jgi:hypothetical protein
LALLKLLSGDGKRSVIVLEAFFDESGTHAGAPLLCVGGYFGTHEQWSAFLEKWSILDFHAKNSPDKDKYKLAEIIEECVLDGVVSFVDPQKYVAETNEYWKTGVGNAFAACALACVLDISKELPTTSVAYVLEEGQPNTEWVARVVSAMANDEHWKPSIASVTVAQKVKFVQLHTADFIVHSWSTNHPIWRPQLTSGRVREIDITPTLGFMSEQLKQMYRTKRAERRRLKKEQKKELDGRRD